MRDVITALRAAATVLAAPRKAKRTKVETPAREPPGKMFHVTTPEAAAAILDHGFKLSFVRHGRDMGPGVYGTPNRAYAEGQLAKRFRERFGAGAAMLEVKIPTKLLEIDTFSSWYGVYRAIIGADAAARYDADSRNKVFANKSPEQVWETVLQPMIKDAGFLGCLETGHPSTANICVFDPGDVKALAVVDMLEAA